MFDRIYVNEIIIPNCLTVSGSSFNSESNTVVSFRLASRAQFIESDISCGPIITCNSREAIPIADGRDVILNDSGRTTLANAYTDSASLLVTVDNADIDRATGHSDVIGTSDLDTNRFWEYAGSNISQVRFDVDSDILDRRTVCTLTDIDRVIRTCWVGEDIALNGSVELKVHK